MGQHSGQSLLRLRADRQPRHPNRHSTGPGRDTAVLEPPDDEEDTTETVTLDERYRGRHRLT